MKIINLAETKSKSKKGYFITVTKEEAYGIIDSLASQLNRNDPNSGRKEFYPEGVGYFSIAVLEEL